MEYNAQSRIRWHLPHKAGTRHNSRQITPGHTSLGSTGRNTVGSDGDFTQGMNEGPTPAVKVYDGATGFSRLNSTGGGSLTSCLRMETVSKSSAGDDIIGDVEG